jgi:predicted CoA-binding protein
MIQMASNTEKKVSFRVKDHLRKDKTGYTVLKINPSKKGKSHPNLRK